MGPLWRGFLIFGVIAAASNFVTCCPGTSPKFGNMTADYEIEVGNTLTIKCSLFNHVIPINGTEYYVNSENLVIKFGDTFLETLNVVDEYTVEYVLPHASVNNSGLYYCFLSIPELPTNPFVCTTEVSVGYKPQPVTNFSCIVYGYERLNCTWVKPPNPVKTTYLLYDYVIQRLRRACPVTLDNSCEFRLNTIPPYRKSPSTLNLVLIGKNSLGKYEQYITIDHFKIVKPHEPQKIAITNATKSSVTVHWLMPKGMEYNDFPPGLTFMLKYCPLFGNNPELCGVINQQNKTNVAVTSLVPHTEYKFMLRCRSNAAEGDFMWSPFTNATARTLADVPYLAPVITFSSFQVQNTQSNRTITLYWKSIPSCYENGDKFQYVVYYHKHYVAPRSRRATYDVAVGNQTSHSFFNMDPESAYYFRIFTKNSVGLSSNSSTIIVDKADNLINGPIDISVISYGEGRYNVSWKNDPLNGPLPIQNYTLFWCQNIKPRPFKCEGPLEWMTVFGTNQELNLLDTNTNYQFAVAANSKHSTSGLKWASCVVPYRGVLYKVSDVILTPKNSTSIRVHWTLDCSAQKSVVQEYAITYCVIHANHTCSGPSHVVYINRTLADQHIIGNLDPYTMYKFYVAARTTDGWSEDSSVKYESTMPAAPSDPPRNVRLISVNGTLIKIAFQPPHKPNGKIKQYSVLYGKANSLTNEKHKIDFPVESIASVYEAEIDRRNVFLYTNYSIEVEACVGMACSPPSPPIYAVTDIGAPGPLEPPHLEVINATLVNITWKPPPVANGPIDLYQLTVWREGDEFGSAFNMSGHDSFFNMEVTCDDQLNDGVLYHFRIRAINMKNNVLLDGPFSDDTQTRMCISGSGVSYRLLVGLVIGIAFGLTVLVISIYALAKWMKKKVDFVKGINVQLPDGLNSPVENPLHNQMYHKFKNGLQKNGDSGIPTEMGYEQPFTFVSDKLAKGIDNTFDVTAEECANPCSRREKSGRNQSGDSNISGKGHDSISSAQTNKTLLSIDSGADMDLPPSPDGMFSDTSSSNTTPRSYKPDLESVEENHPTNSTDSGLANGNTSPVASSKHMLEQTAHFPCHIKKKGLSPHRAGQMPPYSRFSIFSPVFMPSYVSFGVHNVHLLEQQSLANSEPSVADFQDDSDSEPLVSGVPPYCRFGLARSAGNGLNITNQSVPVQENLGYSKFGIIYSALGKPTEITNHNSVAAPNYSRITCPRFLHAGSNASRSLGQPFPTKQQLKVVKEQATSNSTERLNDLNTSLESQKDSSEEKLISLHNKPLASNAYVSFSQAVSNTAPPVPISSAAPNPAVASPYSSVTVLADAAKAEATALPSEQQHSSPVAHAKPSAYVTFQDAKTMPLSDSNTDSHNLQAAAGDILSPEEICDNSIELNVEEPGITAHDMFDSLLPEDLDGLDCEDQAEPLDISDISLVDSQPQTDDQSLLDITSDTPVVIKQQPSNGYVTWTELLDNSPSDGTKASQNRACMKVFI